MGEQYIKESEAKVKVDYLDIELLACDMFGLSEEADYNEIEEKIYEEFNCDFDGFQNIVERLLPYASEGVTSLGDKRFKGFCKSNPENPKFKTILVKYYPDDV